MNLDFRNKNPYAIPANLNHKMIPEYYDNTPPYLPPRVNIEPAHNLRRNMNIPPATKPVVIV